MRDGHDKHTLSLDIGEAPKKRGRPALGARPMTPAERKARSRQKNMTTSLELDHAFVNWLKIQAEKGGVTVQDLIMRKFKVK